MANDDPYGRPATYRTCSRCEKTYAIELIKWGNDGKPRCLKCYEHDKKIMAKAKLS